jgi:hypothetical protein
VAQVRLPLNLQQLVFYLRPLEREMILGVQLKFLALFAQNFFRNYLHGRFWFEFLSTFTFELMFRHYLDAYRHDESKIALALTTFHITFVLRFLRFATFHRSRIFIEDFMSVSNKF